MATVKANGIEYGGEIHFSLQGKEEVGKRLVASFLALYFLYRRSTSIR